MKGLYAASISIATIIPLGSRIRKERGYSRSHTQEESRKTQERLSTKQFILFWLRWKISEPRGNAGRSRRSPRYST
ncbi:MAG: hypothetical protein ABSB22_11055 [Thermodesulfobacteriota bacterium]